VWVDADGGGSGGGVDMGEREWTQAWGSFGVAGYHL
jgi:hypothetical protein